MKKQSAHQTALPEAYTCSKILCMLLVVLIHIAVMYTGRGVVTPVVPSDLISTIFNTIYLLPMPLFMALSGAVYYHVKSTTNRYDNPQYFFSSKFKRLLIPYFSIGIGYVAPVMVLLHFTDLSYVQYVFSGILLMKNSRHLWFLPALFLIFTIFYLLNKYIENYPQFFMVIFIILNIGITLLPGLWSPIDKTCQYLLYFFLGFEFEKHHKKGHIPEFNQYYVCIISLILLLGSKILSTQFIFSSHPVLYSGIRIFFSICGMIFLFSLSTIFTECSKLNIRKYKLYQLLQKDCFGIYLFHPMIIYTIFYFAANQNINPWILSGASFLITLILSTVLVEVLYKAGLHMVLGERHTK